MKDRNQDPIEKRIRLTGPRPAVPDETARRVKAAVHRHWHDTVEANRRPRRLRTGLALAAAAAILTTLGLVAWDRFGTGNIDEAPVLVAAVQGSASWSSGDRLEYGSDVSTGTNGAIVLQSPTGHSIRIDANSRILLLESDLITMDRGRLYIDSSGSKEPAGNPMNIRTSLGDIRETGTQYEIRLSDTGLRVRTREGRVDVAHDQGVLVAEAGEELRIGRYGDVTRGTIRSDSGEWDWAVRLAPMMTIEGRPVMQFLGWAARERGLELQFEDVDLLAEAADTVLSGSIQGMSLDQALEAVLPTCGMTHRIHNGTLTVLRAN
jgi:ferric-dicitrate binding protein FerR (iron transport regulator)